MPCFSEGSTRRFIAMTGLVFVGLFCADALADDYVWDGWAVEFLSRVRWRYCLWAVPDCARDGDAA